MPNHCGIFFFAVLLKSRFVHGKMPAHVRRPQKEAPPNKDDQKVGGSGVGANTMRR
jgi:hypothetical protein